MKRGRKKKYQSSMVEKWVSQRLSGMSCGEIAKQYGSFINADVVRFQTNASGLEFPNAQKILSDQASKDAALIVKCAETMTKEGIEAHTGFSRAKINRALSNSKVSAVNPRTAKAVKDYAYIAELAKTMTAKEIMQKTGFSTGKVETAFAIHNCRKRKKVAKKVNMFDVEVQPINLPGMPL